MAKFTIRQILSFYFSGSWLSQSVVVWSRLGDKFYPKIPDNIVHLILQDLFWIVHLPRVRIVKFKFLHDSQLISQPHQVVLRKFTSFSYNKIDRFVSITT